ncbi:MAG: type II CAAX endopeptidase family protein [Candidatus Solibacter sp.]|nr:type II CAAX endopeptidase family protein [Candidatus Solibacter sp.]
MMEEPEGPAPLHPSPLEPLLPEPPAPPPERDPFWGYADLLIFAGLAIPCMLLGFGLVKAAFWILHLHPAVKTWELLAAQFAFYALLFGTLVVLCRMQYDRPFWRSLGWVAPRLPFFSVAASGVGPAVAVSLLGALIRTPHTENPLTELLKNPTSLILVAVFGTVVAPVCEELLFRGFLQPLLVRSLGALAGILLTAIPFGMLHYEEYGRSWRHVLLISVSGVAFGWMRQATGSTKAAAGMHSAYNAFQFGLWLMAKGLPQ